MVGIIFKHAVRIKVGEVALKFQQVIVGRQSFGKRFGGYLQNWVIFVQFALEFC